MSGTLKIAGTTLATNPTNSKVEIDDAVSGKGICKAWVNFNGEFDATTLDPPDVFTLENTGIRDAFNVSSVNDEGVGKATINFANPIGSHYSAVGNHNAPSSGSASVVFGFDLPSYYTSAQLTLTTFNSGTGFRFDATRVSVAVFGS